MSGRRKEETLRYTVDFEMHSDLGHSVSEVLHKALQSAFGSIDKLRVVQVRTYIGYIQQDKPIIWREVSHNQGVPGRFWRTIPRLQGGIWNLKWQLTRLGNNQ